MNGTNGNEPGYPEKALVPYPVILAATKGDPDAMKIVLQHFSGYIFQILGMVLLCLSQRRTRRRSTRSSRDDK